MKNQRFDGINKIEDEEELLELREFLLYDLRNAVKTRDRIGSNDHIDEMINLFLDQLSLIDKKLKEKENNK